MDIEEKIRILKTVDVLSFFHDTTLERLAEESPEISLQEGEILFQEGATGNTMYIVLEGEILIFREDTNLSLMGPGSFFGEMALIENQPRSAGARAVAPTLLMEIDEKQFQGYFAGQPKVLMAIMKTMSSRFRKSPRPSLDWPGTGDPAAIAPGGSLEDLEANRGPLLLLNGRDFRILNISESGRRETGHAPGALMGKSFLDLAVDLNKETLEKRIAPLLNGTRPMAVLESRIQRGDGTTFLAELHFQMVDGAGDPPQILAGFKDITERREMEETIRQMAYYDSLTGLPNRNLLNDRLAVALARARRNQEQVCLLFLDLDNFKTVNDTLGHATGDQLLKVVAQRLKSVLRKEDTVARMGGDEFIIVAPEMRESRVAATLSEKILNQFQSPVCIDDHELFIGCSIGVAIFPDDGEEVPVLLKNADLALYRAKDLGRNNFQLYTPALNRKAMERLNIEKNMRKGLERGEFELEYQPRIDLKSGRIVGVEALVRWESPELGRVMPGEFIPVAEDTRFILQLGFWTLNQACQVLKDWEEAGIHTVSLAVNLSTVQFTHPSLLKEIQRALEAAGIDPERLELEITESILMRETDLAVEVLNRLRELGLKVAIDDFGTGYSSLNYLKNLPIHYLKIDQTFIQDFEQPTNLAITKAIIALAQSLGLRTIAEGVETPEQCRFLKDIHCDEAQGYLFSHPRAETTIRRLLLSGEHFGEKL